MQLEFHQLEYPYAGLRIHDAKQRSQLMVSLQEHGQRSPILVVPNAKGNDGRYVLIDGYLRVDALKRLGRDTVEGMLIRVDESTALCWAYSMQGARHRTAIEDAWLICELIEHHKMNQVTISAMLGRSVSWVSRRYSLVHQLPAQAQNLLRQGKLCSYGAMRHLVPLARANRSDCERIVESIAEAKLSARQLGRLVVAFQAANEEERQRILDKPLLYLKTEQVCRESSTQHLTSHVQLLREDIERIGQSVQSAIHRLKVAGHQIEHLPLVIDPVWERTLLSLAHLKELLEEQYNVRPRHPQRGLCASSQGVRQKKDRQASGDF